MRSIFQGFCLLLLLACLPGGARAQEHLDFCDDVESTAGMMDCVRRGLDDAQVKLNMVYQELTQKQAEEIKEELFEAQNSWLSYRDAQCAWAGAQAESPALERVYELSCLKTLTEQRADLLAMGLYHSAKDRPREFGTYPRWMNVLAHDHPDVFWRYGKRMRTDLDCDSEEEHILTGVALSSKKDDKTMRVVLAVAENPPTGKPEVRVLSFPVTKTADEPGFCNPDVKVQIVTHPLEPAASGDTPLAEGEGPPTCSVALQIRDSVCAPVILYWGGKEYVAETVRPDSAE